MDEPENEVVPHVSDEDEDDWDDESLDLNAWERFAEWLDRQQWVAVTAMAVGVVIALFYRPRIGWVVVGSSLVLAGLFPVVSGRYRSPFGVLVGWKARLRGLVSVALGGVVISLGLSM